MYAELKLKVCKTCGKMKDKKEFHRKSRGKDTTTTNCKDCRSDYEFVRGLRRNYGISPEIYQELLSNQNDSCACCGEHKSAFKRRLHVDHDHTTGQVRALLCTRCNPLVGFAKENIERLEMARTYLMKFKKLG
jgi:hypothetical protein